ncbi:hypothetical protein ABB55_25415 [Prosthecomicrobium hirschii]|uniref:Glucose-methanol-choline oxidoreductase N-terminal domain-containing protein n=2 Tax=Prosthecodimorpha hirschii TaxID=665126 RepID=A0A0P6VUF0_9HYPH|nr:hypothetical protein ABB55_25415 [Prosthecomicrobium hirschii]
MSRMHEFDFVVVGGGSAGCVVAARLSEDASVDTCLLEAGPSDWNPLYRVPMLAGRLYRARPNNWFYETEPQPHLDGRRIFWPRGRMLGGSFIFNGMVYIRGSAADFDGWAQRGNPGWSHADVLPAFRKSEGFAGPADRHHGTDGPLPVTPASRAYGLFDRFVEAGVAAGHPLNRDFNGDRQAGVGFYHFNILNGRRQTTATTFLAPARRRRNLTVRPSVRALRLVVEGGRIAGVEVLSGGRTTIVRARREVILCAGAVNTPQLLLLSGIGPAGHLASVGIRTLHDLPGVGENLHDHLDVAPAFACLQPVSMVDNLRLDRFALNLLRFAATGTGPAGASPIQAGGFFASRDGLEAPDLQAFLLPIAATNAALWMPLPGRRRPTDTFSIRIGPIRPQSRGHLRLRSADPLAAPLIQPNYLAAEADLTATVAGVRLVRDLVAGPAFDGIRGPELAPTAAARSDAEIAAWVRATASSVYHPVGTARMGPDPMAVVDARLKLRGLDGLRIADASVMPDIVSGNTNAATIMIGERAAAFALADART